MEINLAPSGDFALTLPTGRTVFISNTPAAAAYLHQLLFTAQMKESQPRGVSHYPSQAEIDAFMRKAAQERKEKVYKDYGVDISSLIIDI